MSIADHEIVNEQLRGTFISRQVNRTNRNLFFVNLLLILGVCGYFALNWRYLSNFAAFPTSLSADQLASVKDPNSLHRYFISVHGQKSFETGLQSIERETSGTTQAVTSETIKADYLVLSSDGRLLVVKAPPHKAGKTEFEGALVELPKELRANITSEVANRPDIVRAFLPVMLDATGFREEGYWTIAICLPILVFAGWNIRKVYLRTQNPAIHPIWKTLAGYGSVPQLVMNIDADLRGTTEKVGGTVVTSSWILRPRFFELQFCRILDIVWAYKKITSHSINFIPTGKTYAALVFGRNGIPVEVDGKITKIDGLLQIIASRAPWAVIGFSKDLDKTIRANWLGFVAEIDQRHSNTNAAGA
jgi:hypothetical protein